MIYTLYKEKPFISYWVVRETRPFWFDRTLAEFPVYYSSDTRKVWHNHVVPFMKDYMALTGKLNVMEKKTPKEEALDELIEESNP